MPTSFFSFFFSVVSAKARPTLLFASKDFRTRLAPLQSGRVEDLNLPFFLFSLLLDATRAIYSISLFSFSFSFFSCHYSLCDGPISLLMEVRVERNERVPFPSLSFSPPLRVEDKNRETRHAFFLPPVRRSVDRLFLKLNGRLLFFFFPPSFLSFFFFSLREEVSICFPLSFSQVKDGS